jgi:hypothetical protein
VLFIARSGSALYVAHKGSDEESCWIDVIPAETVRALRIREYRNDKLKCNAIPSDDVPELAAVTTSGGSGTVTPAPVIVTVPAPRVAIVGPPVTVTETTTTVIEPPPTTVTETVASPPVTVTQVRTIERPAGAYQLGDGRWGIPVESVKPPLRLTISAPRYSRTPLDDTRPILVTFRVSTANGYVVEGARVYVRALRANYFDNAEATTGHWGFARLCLRPTDELPFGPGVRIALFVRAWNPSEPLLAGTSQRRLVQLHLGERRTTAGVETPACA